MAPFVAIALLSSTGDLVVCFAQGHLAIEPAHSHSTDEHDDHHDSCSDVSLDIGQSLHGPQQPDVPIRHAAPAWVATPDAPAWAPGFCLAGLMRFTQRPPPDDPVRFTVLQI